ncbi:ABC transporter permease [Actinocatenispora rupis]|uniref:ABC transporter n=1 Tax=Actinocatenispora rupis TaxID=519421 RepID=A0A8J3NFT7_9ACTN|nr:ABC transporter permease [Actinocatenispora rupis]GID14159.1 ABC transporter [Actinocatenispora rupis]
MIAALRAEWTKIRTLASTAWLLIGTAVLTTGVGVVVAATTHQSSGSGGQDTTTLALTGIDLGQAVIVVLAVLAITEEYGTGMIRTSFAAVPRRITVLGAKAAAVAALTLAAGAVAVAGSLVAGRLVRPGGLGADHGSVLGWFTHGPTSRAAAGSVLYLVLVALLALGIATAVRDTAVSIGVVLAVLYLPTLLARAVGDPLRRHIEQVAPMTAGLAVQATTNLTKLPISPWAGIGVLAAWAAGALLLACLLLRHRDP